MPTKRSNGFCPRAPGAVPGAPSAPVSANGRAAPAPEADALRPPLPLPPPPPSRAAKRSGRGDAADTARSAASTARRKAKGSGSGSRPARERGAANGGEHNAPRRVVPVREALGVVEMGAEPNSPPKLLIAQDLRRGRAGGESAPSPRVGVSSASAKKSLVPLRHSVASTVSPPPATQERNQTATPLFVEFDSPGDSPSRSHSTGTTFYAIPHGPVVSETWARSVVQPLDEYLLYSRDGGKRVGYEEMARRRQALQLREKRARQQQKRSKQDIEEANATSPNFSSLRRMHRGKGNFEGPKEDGSDVESLGEEEERARTIQLHERHIIARGTPLLFRRPRRGLFVDKADDEMKGIGGTSGFGKMDQRDGCENAEEPLLMSSNGRKLNASTDVFMPSSIISKGFNTNGSLGATRRPLLSQFVEESNTNNGSINNDVEHSDNSVNFLSNESLQCVREAGTVPNVLDSNGGNFSSGVVLPAATVALAAETSSLLLDEYAAAALLNDPLFVLTSEENFERLVIVQEEHESRKAMSQKSTGATDSQCCDGDDRNASANGIAATSLSKSPALRVNKMRFEQPKNIHPAPRRRIEPIDVRSQLPQTPKEEELVQQEPQQEEEVREQDGGSELVEPRESTASTQTGKKQTVGSSVVLPKKISLEESKERHIQCAEENGTPSNYVQKEQQRQKFQKEKQEQEIPRVKREAVRAVKRQNGDKPSALSLQQETLNPISELHQHDSLQARQSAPEPLALSTTSNNIPSPTSTIAAADDQANNKPTSVSADSSTNEDPTLSPSRPPFPPLLSHPLPLSSDCSVRHTFVDTKAWSIPFPVEPLSPSPTCERARSESTANEPNAPNALECHWVESPRAVAEISPKHLRPSKSVELSPCRASLAVSSAAEEDSFFVIGTSPEENAELREFLRFALKEEEKEQRMGSERNIAATLLPLRANQCGRAKPEKDGDAVMPCEAGSEEEENALLYGGGHYAQNVACILSTFGQLWRSAFHEEKQRDELPEAVQAQLLFFNSPKAHSQ